MRKISLLVIVVLLMSVVSTPMAQVGDEPLPDFIAESRTPCEVDLSGETIQFWHIGDLSSPSYSPITLPFVDGFDHAVQYFNERGGICGAEITLPDPTTIDTGGDQEVTQVIYDRVSEEDPRFVLLYSSQDSELLREQLAEDEIVSMISAGSIEGLYGEDANTPGWVFATNPLYVDQFGQFCEYASENFEDPVIGYISWPIAFGVAAFTPEAIAYCGSLGVTVLEEPELFAPGADISGAVQNLVDQGANILYTNTLATGPVQVASTVNNLGLSGQVQVAGVNWVMDTSVGLLGQQSITPEGLPAVNGIIGSLPFLWWTETDNPGITLITEQADLREVAVPTRNIAYLGGWFSIDVFIEIVVQTANRTGGNNFTGADLKETIEGLDYSSMGGIVYVNYGDGTLRDVELNRMAVLTYAGVDGGTVLDGQAPLILETANGPLAVPVAVGLEEFRPTPDLRPGGADVPESE